MTDGLPPRPRRLIVSPQLRIDGQPEESGPLLLLPNRQAARSSGVPYRSLEGLAKRVVEAGGLRVAPKLLAYRLLRRATARAGVVDDPAGMARAAEGTLRELLRAGVDLERLQQDENPRVSRLAKIASGYRRLLADQGFVDAAELLWRAAEMVREPLLLQLQGFPRLPAAERAFLDAVAAPGSTVHLPLGGGSGQSDGGSDALFAESLEAIAYFRSRDWSVEEGRRATDGLGPELAALFLGEQAEERLIPTYSLACYGYADTEAEVRGTLAAVKRLLDSGVTPDRIAIVARQEERYGDSLLAVADEYRVPLRVLYGVPLSQTRFGAWSSELALALKEGLPFEETARLLAHPLVNVLDREMWSDARRQHTSGWQAWSELLPAFGERWPETATRNEFVALLESLLKRLGVPERALLWAREARAMSALSDELHALPAGDQQTTLENFVAEVDELVRLLTVPVQPGRGGVELHTPLSLFGASVDHLFVVGAAEGVLPSPVRPDPLLDPFEREELRAAGYEIEDVASEAVREELSFWALLHSARTSLTLSFPKLLGKSESLPSPYLARLGLQPGQPPPSAICSPRELRRTWLQGNETFDEVLEVARHSFTVEARRESSAPFDEHDGVTGRPYLPPRGGMAVTGLISLASCQFKFFGERVLRLAEPEEAAEHLDPSLRGRLFHEVLQSVMERARDAEDPRTVALEALDEAFAVAEEVLELTALASWPLEREGHLGILRRALASEQFIHPEAQVRELESSFGATWREIEVRGRVDRMDSLPRGLELLDYKSGATVSNLAKDRFGRPRIDLQLTIYREAAAEALAPGEPVAGSRYFSVSKAEDLRTATPSEEELERIAGEVRSAWREGSYPVLPDIAEAACRYCPLDPVCRKGPRLDRKRSRM